MFQRLSDIIQTALEGTSISRALKERMVFSIWQEVVGERIASNAFPYSLRGRTLYVSVASSAWCMELSLMKRQILERMNLHVEEPLLEDIRFGVSRHMRSSKMQDASLPEEEPEEPPGQEPLSPSEVAAIEDALDEVNDKALRAALLRLMHREARTRKWKMNRGWVRCATCATLVKDSQKCPFCKLIEREEILNRLASEISTTPWEKFEDLKIRCPDASLKDYIRLKSQILRNLSMEINAACRNLPPNTPPSAEIKAKIVTYGALKTGKSPQELTREHMESTVGRRFAGFFYMGKEQDSGSP